MHSKIIRQLAVLISAIDEKKHAATVSSGSALDLESRVEGIDTHLVQVS